MLDDYKDGQPDIYELFVNLVKNNKVSHAYLIDSNNNSRCLDIILSIAKMIICPKNYTNSSKCENCHVCNRIDLGSYLEIKIIRPDGNYIKREQIKDLQDDFSKIGIEGNKRIYIILECEKMTDSTANSILKFLEEPQSNIIAFLISNNINSVLATIKSRCQILKLYANKIDCGTTLEKVGKLLCNSDDEYINFVNSTYGNNLIIGAINYIKYYEQNGLTTIVFNEKLLDLKKKSREELSLMFDIIINFYYDCLFRKIGKELVLFDDYNNEIDFVTDNNTEENILKKISILIEYKDLIKKNLNVNLLIDDMIIKFEGDKNE